MGRACFSFSLRQGSATRRTAGVISSVLVWSSLDACAQLIGIETYDEQDVLQSEPGKLADAGASTIGRPDGGGPDASGAGGDDAATSAGGAASGSAVTVSQPSPGGSGSGGGGNASNTGNGGQVGGGAGNTDSDGGDGGSAADECTPGQVRCLEGNAFECDRGEWDLADACTSSEVCRAGACVEARRDLGNATDLADTVTQPSETLLLYRLTPQEHDAVLVHFGVVGDAAGVQARLVLYADGPDGLAPAGAVVAQTGGLSFALAAGSVVTVAPAAADTVLSAGAAYWVGVVTSETTRLRVAADAPTALRVVSFAPFNAPFGPAETGQLGPQLHLNVFIGVRELQ